MGVTKAIGEVFGTINIWLKGKKGRVRRTIDELKAKRKRIMSQPPTRGKVKKVEAITKKIKRLEQYLIQE